MRMTLHVNQGNENSKKRRSAFQHYSVCMGNDIADYNNDGQPTS